MTSYVRVPGSKVDFCGRLRGNLSFLIQAAVVLMGATVSLSSAAAFPRPSGLYVMDPCAKDGTCPPLPAFVDGIYVRVNWDQIQQNSPTEYNWSRVDHALAEARAAKKQLQIGVWPGIASPHWLYSDAGAQYFPMRWDLHWGPPNCSIVKTPLPWDTVFLAAWGRFIAELGKRYDHDPNVVGVKVTGVDAQTMEQVLPTKMATGCHNATDPASIWAAKGYTPQRIEAAWTLIMGFYQQAFTRTSLILMTGPWGFPGIDNQGRLTGADDKNLTVKLMTQFMLRIGVDQGGLQNNGACPFWAWTPPPGLPVGTVFGVQAYGHVTNDTGCKMVHHAWHPCTGPDYPVNIMNKTLQNVRKHNNAYFEVERVDITNPVLATLLGEYAAEFPAPGPPPPLFMSGES